MWKSLINLALGALVFIFRLDISSLLGQYIYYLVIPICFSMVFFLISSKYPRNAFSYVWFGFLTVFAIVYALFNYGQSNFQAIDFILALLITVAYVYIQEKLVPEKSKDIKSRDV